MANPRMIHELNELFVRRLPAAGNSTILFERDKPFGTSKRYAPVKFVANTTVALCADGDTPVGSIERVESDGTVVVAWLGTITFAGTATPGAAVVGNGAGGVRDADPADGEIGLGQVGMSANNIVIVIR